MRFDSFLVRCVVVAGVMLAVVPAHAARAKGNAAAHNYPTADRVVYVQACTRDHPGNHYEMINKCACAIDRIAADVTFEDYTSMATAANANSIGGERGSYMRDSEGVQGLIKRHRELQTRVKKACYVIQ